MISGSSLRPLLSSKLRVSPRFPADAEPILNRRERLSCRKFRRNTPSDGVWKTSDGGRKHQATGASPAAAAVRPLAVRREASRPLDSHSGPPKAVNLAAAPHSPVDDTVTVTVRMGDAEHALAVERGTILRDALLDAGFEVYAPAAKLANCGGRGLCATCGVRVSTADGAPPAADHWHDSLAARYGYPRLSCQLSVDQPLTVELIEKRYWGQLLPKR